MSFLRKLADEINDILLRYVRVHEDVFAASLRTILPIPGFFRPIKYCEHAELLQRLNAGLGDIRAMIGTAGRTTPATAEFAQTLEDYTDSLSVAVEGLSRICQRFCASTRGQQQYPAGAFGADTKEYQKLVDRYTIVGKRLTAQYHSLPVEGGDASQGYLETQMANLVPAVARLVSGSQQQFALRWPELGRFRGEVWDTVLVAATLTGALSSLRACVDDETYDALRLDLSRTLRSLRINPIDSMANCHDFLVKTLQIGQHDYSLQELLGLWVLWNLYGRYPSAEEAAPSSHIGIFISEPFRGWWAEGGQQPDTRHRGEAAR